MTSRDFRRNTNRDMVSGAVDRATPSTRHRPVSKKEVEAVYDAVAAGAHSLDDVRLASGVKPWLRTFDAAQRLVRSGRVEMRNIPGGGGGPFGNFHFFLPE
jgi:hypothetical protein